jgi:hypothetical protein
LRNKKKKGTNVPQIIELMLFFLMLLLHLKGIIIHDDYHRVTGYDHIMIYTVHTNGFFSTIALDIKSIMGWSMYNSKCVQVGFLGSVYNNSE